MAHTFIQDLDALNISVGPFRLFSWRTVIAVCSLMLAITLTWYLTTAGVADLGSSKNLVSSGLVEQWKHGDVVVMIRHAERCDRSANRCLGSADGITVNGSHVASDVGAGLQRLGLERTHMIASPSTRTQQTASYIAGQAVVAQDWVGECNKHFKDEVVGHKVKGENLVLITHSGCIDHFERAMGMPAGERSSEYTQAFFVKMDGKAIPRILGSLSAEQWKSLTHEQLK
ncbi:lipopolysaccharide core heptose(II)-phosphate phosphatase PmrG [Pseudomonas triticifolii]|uniref:Histidine phosphatase family protein n=1 Tax=Pseudomonas triticifolii TaxID=2762592 RepID=A0ABR7BIQ5_9PSED|nr:histidine phosphatase family protein [Pseudomonas triticifolii]MBC3957073.1 histidine phosphatase family protein [Pseudomonas triticifolii]